jgi:hypothetical protein
MKEQCKVRRDIARRQFLKSAPPLVAGALVVPEFLTSIEVQAQNTGLGAPLSPAIASNIQWEKHALLRPNLENSIEAKYLSKPVHASMMIDDMETDKGWKPNSVVQMEYTTERAKSGTRSLRFKASQKNPGDMFDNETTASSMRIKFDPPQDWSKYNRISIWAYMHSTSPGAGCLCLGFICDGASAGPCDPVASHYIQDLKPGEWNHMLWEIPDIQRDKVSQFVIFQSIWGVPREGEDPAIIYDFDQFELQKVDVEPYEGWAVPPGKISFNHVGYLPSGEKIAVSGATGVREFDLLDAAKGTKVATFPVKQIETRRGRYGVLDFTSFTKPGWYRLRCGDDTSGAFSISDDIWQGVIEKSLNYFYATRCGWEIPEIHDACHLDLFVEYKGVKRSLAGGWHDAAGFMQGSFRTNSAIYAMLQVYRQLEERKLNPNLSAAVLEEARWGLEWIMRTRFGKGERHIVGSARGYTDSKVGTADDQIMMQTVQLDPFENMIEVAVLGLGARVLKPVDAGYSAALLAAAEEDYAASISQITPPDTPSISNMNLSCWRDKVGYATLAAVEMYRNTGKQHYAEDAARLGRLLLRQQEQRFVEGIPIAGYFYEDPQHTKCVHEFHSSFEESGLLALQGLCDALPNHPDWISWYGAIVLYSEFFCLQGSQITEPFRVTPLAVWRRSELDLPIPEHNQGRIFGGKPRPEYPTAETEELKRAHMRRMFDEGTPLSEEIRLRVFPIWFDHIRHGCTTVHMSLTAGLASAARVRNQRSISDLVARQMQWTFGGNPLSQCLMYGEGYDYHPLFTVLYPNIVGAFAVGMDSLHNDSPYWPNSALFPTKEIWIVPCARALLNLAYAGMPARVNGTMKTATTFHEMRTGKTTPVEAGKFGLTLPPGDYTVNFGKITKRMSLVDGANYELDLDPAYAIDLELTAKTLSNSKVEINGRAKGAGKHKVELRAFNGSLKSAVTDVQLVPGREQSLRWELQVTDPEKPWVVAAVPDSRIQEKKELFGTMRELPKLA